MTHYLSIKIQTDPVNAAFADGNMGNELSRILIKYANSIKDIGEAELYMLDTCLLYTSPSPRD